MPLNIDVELNLKEIEAELKKAQKVAEKSGEGMSKGLGKLEQGLKKIPQISKAFDKERKEIEKSRDKQLDNQKLTAKKRKKITEKANKDIQAAHKRHFKQITKLQKRAAKEQEKIARRSAKNQTGILKKLSGSAKGLIAGAGIGAAFALAATAMREFKDRAKEVEEAFASLSGQLITTGEVLTQSIIDSFNATARAVGAPIEEIIEAAEQAIGSGRATGESVGDFIDDIARFAAQTGSSVAAAESQIGEVMLAFDKNVGDAVDIMDLFAKTADSGSIPSMQALGNAFAKGGVVANALGLDMEDLATIFASTTSQGFQLSQVSRSLDTIVASMQDSLKVGQLFELGTVNGFDKINQKITDSTAFFDSLSNIYEENGAALLKIFPGPASVKLFDTLFDKTGKGFLDMQAGISDAAGTFGLKFAEFASTAAFQDAQFAQQTEQMSRRAGETFLELERGVNTLLISLFETSEDRAQKHFDQMERLRGQADIVGQVLSRGLAVEADFNQAEADAYFKSVENNLDVIADKSPFVAAQLKRIIESSEGATPEGLAEINNQLANMQTRLNQMAGVEASKALSESFDQVAISSGAAFEAVEGDATKTAMWLFGASASFDDMIIGFTEGIGKAHAATTGRLGVQMQEALALNRDTIAGARAELNAFVDANKGLSGAAAVEAGKQIQIMTEGLINAENTLQSIVDNIVTSATGMEDVNAGIRFGLEGLKAEEGVSGTLIRQVEAQIDKQIRLNEQAELRAAVEEDITKALEEQDAATLLIEQEAALADINAQIDESIEKGGVLNERKEEHLDLLDEQEKLTEGIVIINEEIAKTEQERIENEKSINDVLTANNLSMDDLLKAQDANLLKEKAILVAKKQTLLAIRQEIINKIESLKASNSDIDAQNLLRQAVRHVNEQIEEGNALLEARAAGDFSVKLSAEQADIETFSQQEAIDQLNTMLANTDAQLAEVNKGIEEVDKGLGNVDKSASQAAKSFADIQKETEKIVSERQDLEFEASIVDLEGSQRDLAVLDRNYKDMIANLPPELAGNQKHMEELWALHQQKVSAINRSAAQERAEDEKKASEDAAKVREDKAKELAKQQEDAAKAAADRQKRMQEEAIKAIEDRRKREQQFNDFLIDLNQERLGAISGLEQRADLIKELRSQEDQIRKDFQGNNVKMQILLDKALEDAERQLKEFTNNALLSSEELFMAQRDNALTAFNDTLEILGGVTNRFNEQMIGVEDGITQLPWDVFIEGFRELLEVEAISIERLDAGLISLRRNAQKYNKENEKSEQLIRKLVIVNDLIVQFELKKIDIAQDRDELLLRELILMEDAELREDKLSKLQLKSNKQRVETLELTKDTEASRLRIIELEEENLEIINQLIQPYKDVNQIALDFLNQRVDGLEGEKTAIESITESYAEQTDLLNDQITKIEAMTGAEQSRRGGLLNQISLMEEQKAVEEEFLALSNAELGPFKEKHAVILETNVAIQEEIDLKKEAVNLIDQEIESAQENKDILEENVRVSESRIEQREKFLAESARIIQKALDEGRSAVLLMSNRQNSEMLQEDEKRRLLREKDRLNEFNEQSILNELLEERNSIQSEILEKQEEINKNTSDLGPDEERVKILQEQVLNYQDQIVVLDKSIESTQELIDLGGENTKVLEDQNRELERSREIRNRLEIQSSQERVKASSEAIALARRQIEDLDMSQFQISKRDIEVRTDALIDSNNKVFVEAMALEVEGSEARKRLDEERIESNWKLKKKGDEELLELQLSNAKKVIAAIGTAVGSIETIITGIIDIFSAGSVEEVLGAITGVLDEAETVANTLGPIGETVGGIIGVVSGLIDSISNAISGEISQSERLTIEIQKQTELLGIQKNIIETLIKLGDESLDTAMEQVAAYEKILAANGQILKMNGSITEGVDDQQAIISRIAEIQKINAGFAERIAFHKARGKSSDLDSAERLQRIINNNNNMIGQLQDQLDLITQINDLRKQASRELLDQIDFMDQTGLSDEIALQTKSQIIDTMLEQKDINGNLLFSEQERNDLLLEQEGILTRISEIQLAIEQSILRQSGHTEDSIVFLMSQLSGLQKDRLDVQQDAADAFQTLVSQVGKAGGIAEDQLFELSELMDIVLGPSFDPLMGDEIDFIQTDILEQIQDILSGSMIGAEFVGAAGLENLRDLVSRAISFDEQTLNELLEEEDELTKNIVDRFFEVQQNRLEHQLAIGEITQKQFNEQNSDLVATWAKVYEDARALLTEGVLDPTTFDQVMADINEQFGDIAADMGVDLADLDLGDLIISEQDLFDIQAKGIQAASKFIDGLTAGLSDFQRLQFQLDKLKHEFELEEITAEEFNEPRLDLLNQQLDILVEQREEVDKGVGLTKELWDLDKDIWKLEEQINDLQNQKTGELEDQTAELLKQAGLGDAELERLSKKRQLFIESARAAGTFTSPEVQTQLAQIEADVVARMRELGVDDATIFNAVQAMQEQRSFEEGGEVPSTGAAFVHKGEFIIPASSVQSMQSQFPAFLESLRGAQTSSGVQQIMQESVTRMADTDAAIRQQTFNNITNVANNGGNTLGFNITGTNADQISNSIIERIRRELPGMLTGANQKAGIVSTR